MQREEHTQVLVVGAGPVGLFTALRLAQRGLRVRVVDLGSRPAAHSYACALHPHALELLQSAGVAADLLARAHRVESAAFYHRTERVGEVRFGALTTEFPFLAVLPQADLELLLERAVYHQTHVEVSWNHRVRDLQPAGEEMVATVDQLGQTATGYIVPKWEWVVKKTLAMRARFVVGTDGAHSFVRHRLGIETVAAGAPEVFAVYEFETGQPAAKELRVVVDEHSVNGLWPLPGGRLRWSFQVALEQMASEFPAKDRENLEVHSPAWQKQHLEQMQKFLRERAPWFNAPVTELDWATGVRFHRWVVRRFGRNRCWLAGDAAHQTGPLGIQSMNEGLIEAELLAETLANAILRGGGLDSLEAYHQSRLSTWERLLGIRGTLKARPHTHRWIAQNAGRILACLPASGRHLSAVAAQLGLDFV